MQGLNTATLIGNLGHDPELRYTQAGTAVLSMRLAVTERTKRGDDWTDVTQWFTAIVFGKRAEGLSKFLRKGRTVCAVGRISQRTWEAKDGTERLAWELLCEQLVPLGGDGPKRKPSEQASLPGDGYGPPNDGQGFGDDEIPF